MRFVDLAKIQICSGKGGDGSVSFRREKFVEFGGPDGGNGGRGGSVYAQAVENLNTLIDFRYRRHIKAGDGKPGMGKNRSGGAGMDVIIDLPAGTEILNEDRTAVIEDLVETDRPVLLAQGGNGGFGNRHFRSSRNQAPRHANQGQPGIERTLWLRLKVLADVGLVGMPNAGKSTLLSVITNARPKIAAYPFTTLQPNLGLVSRTGTEFVMADIPGLVEGAHEGKGIGDRFLGHVERCHVILHLVDLSQPDPVDAYRAISHELQMYGDSLQGKDVCLVGTKLDLLDDASRAEITGALGTETGVDPLAVSAFSGDGMECLIDRIVELVRLNRSRTGEEAGSVDAKWSP